ncbi:hypothetical protein Tco_0593578 [Tanacetum coccineum]
MGLRVGTPSGPCESRTEGELFIDRAVAICTAMQSRVKLSEHAAWGDPVVKIDGTPNSSLDLIHRKESGGRCMGERNECGCLVTGSAGKGFQLGLFIWLLYMSDEQDWRWYLVVVVGSRGDNLGEWSEVQTVVFLRLDRYKVDKGLFVRYSIYLLHFPPVVLPQTEMREKLLKRYDSMSMMIVKPNIIENSRKDIDKLKKASQLILENDEERGKCEERMLEFQLLEFSGFVVEEVKCFFLCVDVWGFSRMSGRVGLIELRGRVFVLEGNVVKGEVSSWSPPSASRFIGKLEE